MFDIFIWQDSLLFRLLQKCCYQSWDKCYREYEHTYHINRDINSRIRSNIIRLDFFTFDCLSNIAVTDCRSPPHKYIS